MIKDPMIVRIRKWLVKLNIVAGILFGIFLVYFLTSFLYEYPTIILLLLAIPFFLFGLLSGTLIWKWTVGYILAFGVGIWWGHKTRND